MHQIVQHSLNQTTIKNSHLRVQVPDCHRFIRPDTEADQEWWRDHLHRFPPGYAPCNTLQSQRIPPFPLHTRELLVSRFCPVDLGEEILNSKANEDCLIRPYLGRRRIRQHGSTPLGSAPRRRVRPFFSLRNYPLHEDQMEELGIPARDIRLYARMMANALATLHWVGEIDANDVEFVLAPPPPTTSTQSTQNPSNVIFNVFGSHTMWILDFDLCRSLPINAAGMEQAATAFLRNDPFYPRPGRDDPGLWSVFREQYLRTAEECCCRLTVGCSSEGKKRLLLSRLFVELVENGH
ncbi:zinc finger protein [Aspergillus candidus]|uniref:Zinc finger protein-domain-containing protein n=1 Tax=Aspergillus candidus TaxID=41067 RepID=A0A2I2FPR0_ASPCN|nr:zinc finger protein-domain-containing protein [Aspergillus candidus]PLB42622.1 zinc finger protein-domain-containing protein [Aspergillus candidus]